MSFVLSNILPVLNVHSKKTSMLKRKENQLLNCLIRSRAVICHFNIHFLFFSHWSSSQHHSPSMPIIHSIPLLFKDHYVCSCQWGSFAVRDLLRHNLMINSNFNNVTFCFLCPCKSHKLSLSLSLFFQSASLGGAAHLVNFCGTDTVAGMVLARWGFFPRQ